MVQETPNANQSHRSMTPPDSTAFQHFINIHVDESRARNLL